MSHFDYKAELYYSPVFDYLKYFKEGKFTDCQVEFPGTHRKPIKAHAIVIANSSKTLRGAIQKNTTSLQIHDNPMDLFPKVLEFLYSGKLEYTNNEVVCLLHIAKRYDIESLKERMISHLNSNVNLDNICTFSNMCYQYELEDVLSDLVDFFVANFRLLKIENLTQNLDVITFCKILEKLKIESPNEFSPANLVKILNEFIGDFECDDEEKKACQDLFNMGDKNVRALLAPNGKKYPWLPN